MPVVVKRNVDSKKLSSFKIGSRLSFLAKVASIKDIPWIIQKQKESGLNLLVLGEGFNTIFRDTEPVLKYFAIKIIAKNISIYKENTSSVMFDVEAGCNWDAFVSYSCTKNLTGVEALSSIPGSVGAGPVQNIGAYGQEIRDTIVSVYVYDIKYKKYITLKKEQCGFSYRNSIFKTKEKGRYVILKVRFRLSKKPPTIPRYPDIEKYFQEDKKPITSKNIRLAVIEIRSKKLPNPKTHPNVGSFFENIVVKNKLGKKMWSKYPDMPRFLEKNGNVKIPAGWMIDACGLKGANFGPIKIDDKNALVLINTGGATYADLNNAENKIIEAVKSKFGLVLKREPNVIF